MEWLGSVGLLLTVLLVRLVWGRVTDKHVGDAIEKEFLREWEEREKRSQERMKARENEQERL